MDLDLATAQQYYAAAIAAKQQILTTGQATKVQHGPNKIVEYSEVNLVGLNAWIQELDSMIGRLTGGQRRGPVLLDLS